MKIVITARNFSDYDQSALEILKKTGAEIVDYSDLTLGINVEEERIWELAKDADIVVAGVEPYSRDTIRRCPKLKLISRSGIGYNNVDVDACREYGVTLCRTVGAVEGTVAEHVIAYILYFARRIDLQNEYMHRGEWKRNLVPGAKGMTLGLVGFGGIGQEIARRAIALDMKVMYYCRHPRPEWEPEFNVSYAPLDSLLASSDYVSINVPLTPETNGMFNYETICKMKKSAILMNIARGNIVLEADLKRALDEGVIAGAAIDVFDKEPCTDSPLISCKNALLTPHTAVYTEETFSRMRESAAENVVDFIHHRLKEQNKVV